MVAGAQASFVPQCQIHTVRNFFVVVGTLDIAAVSSQMVLIAQVSVIRS
jgi:hypothetical protein